MKNAIAFYSFILFLAQVTLSGAQNFDRWKKSIQNSHPLQNEFESHILGRNVRPAYKAQTHSLFGDVDTAWVRHYISKLFPSDDFSVDMAIDASGNVYVTGYSQSPNPPFRFDYLTIKYNAAGAKIWEVRHGSENDDELAFAIKVDGLGNVYVMGNSGIIKYNNNGKPLWIAFFNGSPIALATDNVGNIYVTGMNAEANTGLDYITVKYNSAGVTQWIARYNGPGNDDDTPLTIVMDASGNVYVTGASIGLSYDYATIKYNSAGVQQWAARYNGTGNSEDVATALAVDGNGNVYVTGKSWGTTANHDYATVKFNSSGAQLWVNRYNGPANNFDGATALAIDAVGSVYVTGNSGTIKYNNLGIQQWLISHDGTTAVFAIDATNNVFVIGVKTTSGYANFKYNSAGVEQSVTRYSVTAGIPAAKFVYALDGSNSVYMLGSSNDYIASKYNSIGVLQWTARYNGAGYGLDQAVALAVDVDGNVYVTGWSQKIKTVDRDFVTIKYNNAGVVQWMTWYNGSENSNDVPVAIAVDAGGNVYVAGSSRVMGAADDYITVKYNRGGVEQWVARYNGPQKFDDRATALAVDAAGNVYVTGQSQESSTNSDFATIKYSAAGIEQWAARYNGLGNFIDVSNAIAVDAAGDVYVSGKSVGSTLISDYVTVKYNSAGTQQWIARYNGSGNYTDEAKALAVDASGNVYVTGFSLGSTTNYDYATIKYNALGIEQWIARYSGSGNNIDVAQALALDAEGNIYVTGYSSKSSGTGVDHDYATVKYNNAGTQLWIAHYNGASNTNDDAKAIAIDATGNVYVMGQSSAFNAIKWITIKYHHTGAEQWIASYQGPTNTAIPAALAIDAAGSVYVTGWSEGANSANWSNYTTIKYTSTTVMVNEKTPSLPLKNYTLSQNYPNPFNPETIIEYVIPAQTSRKVDVILSIYNLQGQFVRTLVKEDKTPGRYSVVWDGRDNQKLRVPSGVYVYQLRAGDFKATKKMAFLK